MKRSIRDLIALLLALLMLSSVAGVAFAEDAAEKYPGGQMYKSGEGDTTVYAVQIACGPNQDGAERLRDQMLRDGFDCFVLEEDGLYRILCGKFTDKNNAFLYREMILKKTEREEAFVQEVSLPKAALDAFVEHFKQDPFVARAEFNGWETPTGAFVDMTSNEEETAQIYVVQFSCGGNFKAAEKLRDQLTEKGFDGYVVKTPCFYRIVAGAFENREDAYALRDEIRQATGRRDSSVQLMTLPASLLG
ncbi:MAG: SPOR domain-containing protein [Oscillospiraceae bacterium]|nr:SPOR domain-containing protein [Oscillospiraceae bacterium]